MNENDTIFTLEYPKATKNKRTVVSIFLFTFFVLLSSYKSPTYRIGNKLINYNTNQFQLLFETQITSLASINDFDTTQNLNNQLNDILIEFYRLRNYKPAWTSGFETNTNYLHYSNLLDSINYFGFPIDYFNKENIYSLKDDFESRKFGNDVLNKRMQLELLVSHSIFKLMVFLKQGIIEEDTSQNYITYLESLPEILNNVIDQQNLTKSIQSLQPQLVQYQNILMSVPYFIDLHRSVRNTTPKFINDMLLAKSLYYTGITESPEFDSINTRESAIFKLQGQYQLPNNLILNNATHQALVSLLDFKYYQACINLHRLRRLGNESENYLFVNIPEFKLHVVESNTIKDTFNVIVGTKSTPTPTLSSKIEKVIANPYWTVPKSIVNNEMIRKIRRDSTYLKKNGYFIIDNRENMVNDSIIDWSQSDPLGNKYWIRQKNSRINSLGQVKFVFPNDYRVYLHDTPNKRLFQRENRTFSHGCVRLENPDKLAQYLSDRFYSEKEVNIDELISNAKRHEIGLSEKVEIHVQYITCTGSENSEIRFYNDVYKIDEKEIKAMFPKQSEI